jgi:hypothetical protein
VIYALRVEEIAPTRLSPIPPHSPRCTETFHVQFTLVLIAFDCAAGIPAPSLTRVYVLIQFVSQVLPPSAENACSE